MYNVEPQALRAWDKKEEKRKEEEEREEKKEEKEKEEKEESRGLGPAIAPPLPNRSQRNRVGFDFLFFFGWIGSTSVGPLTLLRSMSLSVRTLGWGWGFYGSPTLGTTRDLVHVPTSVRSPICECRSYSAPSPAARSRVAPPR